MDTMAERSVDGTVDLDYASSGLTWRLTCPAATVLEPNVVSQFSGQAENRIGKPRLEQLTDLVVGRSTASRHGR
jgi:hypothetical protein